MYEVEGEIWVVMDIFNVRVMSNLLKKGIGMECWFKKEMMCVVSCRVKETKFF